MLSPHTKSNPNFRWEYWRYCKDVFNKFSPFDVKCDDIIRNAVKRVSRPNKTKLCARRSVFLLLGNVYDVAYRSTVYFQNIPWSHHISHKTKLFCWKTYSFLLKFWTKIRVQFWVRYLAFLTEWMDYDPFISYAKFLCYSLI